MTPRVAGFLVVSLLVVTLATQSALAQHHRVGAHRWSPLGLSRHGHHWSEDLRRPLFSKHLVLVPGQTVRRTFYVRNQSGERARLKLSVCVTNSHRALRRDYFRMAVRTRSGWWHHVRRTGSHPVAWRTVRAGAVVPVTVRLRVPPRAGYTSVDRGLRLRLGVRLSQRIR